MNDKRQRLVSVTASDCVWEFFCAGGPGGQKQNKTASACRVTHPPSGAVGESRTHREQHRNKQEAFKRMANSEAFKKWLHIENARALGKLKNIEEEVDRQMRNVKVQVKDENGRWVDEDVNAVRNEDKIK